MEGSGVSPHQPSWSQTVFTLRDITTRYDDTNLPKYLFVHTDYSDESMGLHLKSGDLLEVFGFHSLSCVKAEYDAGQQGMLSVSIPLTYEGKVRRLPKCEYQFPLAVDMDLEKFFDTVNHDVLMHRVARKVRDKRLLKLIGRFLRAGVMVNGRLQQTRKGVPQGGPLSPLLANIVLDDLDKELERRRHRFVRYADDFLILVKGQKAGERVMSSIKRFIERKLKLKVNMAKSRVAKIDHTNFLGFTFKAGKIRWSDAAFKEFKRRIRKLTGRSWFVSMQYRLEKLALYLRGWMNYFGISHYYRPIPEIDHWLRRRVRMCYWKLWRYARTKVRNLLKLGTVKKTAILTAISRKGPWHLSRTLATQTGMTNKWLKDQGLLSVKELWVNIHYPATAR